MSPAWEALDTDPVLTDPNFPCSRDADHSPKTQSVPLAARLPIDLLRTASINQ